MQLSNLEGGLARELRHAHRTVQKLIGLDSNARSRKLLPSALHPVFSSLSSVLLFYYELTTLPKAASAVFEHLDLRKPTKSNKGIESLSSLSPFFLEEELLL